ncbi:MULTISPECIES: aminopeptidase [Pelosinus]|uniref:Peptidase M29 aminopeptidase II n=1 Tax=Pelosinus fermentans B4 TaxID=1149862 RepID=I8RK78_9FIRM|nr:MULTISPECIES: aminopeptidase [Pelosinus]EIW20543.1 peptidase M29 aminopeptidase II [Pelosinus fermentans B4]EIW25742.1 peptidase M29 aminopeptidase II [Pelosinus fermentans A11]OAM93466.1 peptidase M29 aminopeptidase II [Pelosinus fermentans DSM 17108]SDQ78832.1 Leucyl aminopeptidase (aminopeptidase T) [Pelosinus fermentans]
MMDHTMLEKYARLIVKTGVNIQKDQTLVIASPIECAFFARMIAQYAYEEGARDVVVAWKDELLSKIRFLQAPEEVFEEFPEWQKDFYLSYVKQGAAFVSIAASDPELLKDVNPGRLVKVQKASNTALKEYRERLMSNKNTWCVVSIPTKSWAKKVFSELSEDEAVAKLWDAILKTVRVDTQDPVAAWEEHKQNLKKSSDFLNSNQFQYLQYKNSLGTDLKIELPKNHIWLGGSEYTPEGLEFVANMPTEEVFTLPKKTGIQGTVVSSKPLNYNGNVIDHFSLTFKDGKIVDFTAEQGYEILKGLIETDEGSYYLGEVALVPYNSPISNSNILYFNTLFDENASCHLAIGKAYPVCIKDGENLAKEELEALGVNDSLVHVDFMIGTKDLEIIGTTAAGKEIPVFKNGDFAF